MELHETDICLSDELSSAVAKTMVTAVVAMALIVMVTVLTFYAGGTIG
mgnify:CR=1 FL=1